MTLVGAHELRLHRRQTPGSCYVKLLLVLILILAPPRATAASPTTWPAAGAAAAERKHEAMLGFLLRQVREEAGQGGPLPPPGAAGKGAAEAGTGAFARIESFRRQAHMFEYADREALAGAPGSIGYFSVERQGAGGGGGEGGEEPAWFRSYLIASYRSFWHDLYSQRRPEERHYYELIREGCGRFHLQQGVLFQPCLALLLDSPPTRMQVRFE